MTRAPPSNKASAISPNASRIANAGVGIRVGRRRTRPSIFVKSRFVTTPGATALTGPVTWLLVRTCNVAFRTSSIAIHGIYCEPDPSTPPAPSLKGSSIFCKAPPFGVSTMPMRRCTVLIPRSCAGAVAASQAWHTSGRNPCPAGEDSSTIALPRSP